MDRYAQHFLLDTRSIIDYCRKRLDFFSPDAPLQAMEIGDGNINYVFKVIDKNTGRSLVIKQADKLLRSSGRPLDLYRNKIEADVLRLQGELAGDMVPRVYHYDEVMYALAMEDISSYKNLRKEILAGKVFPDFAGDIASFMAAALFPTTDLVLHRHEKKRRVGACINIELCDISEDLVFTEPYYDYKGRNVLTPGNEEFVREFLYEDKRLHAQVGCLRERFMNYAQALLHGDLHSGSVFINETGLKVIDPEFAFYGPMGYDVGNVIGNLFIALFRKEIMEPSETECIGWIQGAIEDVYSCFESRLSDLYDERVDFPLYQGDFKKEYIRSVMEDSLGYAGTEMIRRTVGDAKVAELTTLPVSAKKVQVERRIIKTAIALIKRRRNIAGEGLLLQDLEGVDR